MPVIRLRFENAGKKDWKILEKINGGQKPKKPGIFGVCADLNASKVLMGKGKNANLSCGVAQKSCISDIKQRLFHHLGASSNQKQCVLAQ